MIDLLTKIWVTNPDLRLGQLLCSVLDSTDIYYTEDDELEKLLRKVYSIPKGEASV